MPEPDTSDSAIADLDALLLQLVGHPHLSLGWIFQGIVQNLLLNLGSHPIGQTRGLPGLFQESLQALLLNRQLDVVVMLAADP